MSHLTVPISERDHVRGALNAPVTLLEYGDFECPFCGQAYTIIRELARTLGDQLCFVFRNFPLTQTHPHAKQAAKAAEAAGALGGPDKYWQMHDTLFEHQRALEFDDLEAYARQIGLDAASFAAGVQSGQFSSRIKEDFESGVRSGVNGTPTFFINGERYDGDWTNVAVFSAALTAAVHA